MNNIVLFQLIFSIKSGRITAMERILPEITYKMGKIKKKKVLQ